MSSLEELARQDIDAYQTWAKDQATKAAAFLAAGDYSAAATACHRAHQEQQKANALRILFELPS